MAKRYKTLIVRFVGPDEELMYARLKRLRTSGFTMAGFIKAATWKELETYNWEGVMAGANKGRGTDG